MTLIYYILCGFCMFGVGLVLGNRIQGNKDYQGSLFVEDLEERPEIFLQLSTDIDDLKKRKHVCLKVVKVEEKKFASKTSS